jgi:hypothetical protein
MPLHNLLKDSLTISLHDISVTRNDPVESPLVDPLHTSSETCPVLCARSIPDGALLPLRVALRTLQGREDLCQNSTIRINTRFAKLLSSRQVEHEVCLDESTGRTVVENELFVDVRGDVLPVELGVELGRYGLDALILAKEDGEGDLFVVLLFALFGEDVGAHDLRVRVFLVPGTKEDVVLLTLLGKVLGALKGLKSLPLHPGLQCTSLRPTRIPSA